MIHDVNRRILIVDDNPDIHTDFRKILGVSQKQRNRLNLKAIERRLFAEEDSSELDHPDFSAMQVEYDIDSAHQGEEAVGMVAAAAADGKPYALVFMDVRMPPGIDGIETISRIWARFPNTEMVICTAYSDYSFDEIIKKLGSSDRLLFLTKPFDSIAVKQMALSLTRKWSLHEEARRQVLRLQDEISQRKDSESRLHHLIHHDPLTNLGNRNQLQICLEEAIGNAKLRNTRFALYFVELLRFKEVIDTFGYKNSDKVIHEISRRLESYFRPSGKVFSQGDYEFALLIPEIRSRDHAFQVARQIQDVFQPNFALGDLNIEVAATVGVVIYPDHGCNIDMLMRHADMTLARARKADQGIRFFEAGINSYSPQRLMLLTDLRKALHQNDLLLYYQPRIRSKDRQLVGVEAQIRWPHPVQGFISPNRFIPLAERCGVIRHVTEWVLTEVPKQWALWKEQDLDLQISINITGQEIMDDNLPDRISEALTNQGMPFDRLGIQLTERSIMIDPAHTSAVLRRIGALGVKVTIDNFGTGYSSLSYMKNLPVQELKIDSSFIHEMDDSANASAIVKSMINLGHNLGKEVSATGVAHGDTFDTLLRLGCDFQQGFHINHAVPSGELMLWLVGAPWAIKAS